MSLLNPPVEDITRMCKLAIAIYRAAQPDDSPPLLLLRGGPGWPSVTTRLAGPKGIDQLSMTFLMPVPPARRGPAHVR